jgi:hypothetical protein
MYVALGDQKIPLSIPNSFLAKNCPDDCLVRLVGDCDFLTVFIEVVQVVFLGKGYIFVVGSKVWFSAFQKIQRFPFLFS